MELEKENPVSEQATDHCYTPRPAWQVWAARIGLGIFLLGLALYYLNIAGGGL